MNIVKPFHLSFNRQVLEHDNQFHFIASVTMGVRLSTGEPLLEMDFLKESIENMGSKPLPDVGMPKPCGEYLVSGNFFAPGNQPVGGAEVIVKVGEQEKNILVFGPRHWEAGLPSKPEPITSMPIEYSLAYGGNGLETNAGGVGYQDDNLPNIELPDKLITGSNVKTDPAGFAVLDPACSQRRRYMGTYDDNYLQHYYPGYPADFDWQFFLAAAKDQRIDGYYQGNENFEFYNLHPEKPYIQGQLPGYISRCFLKHGLPDEHQQFTELKLNVDTLWFFPEIDLALVICRGGMQVRDDEAEQISDVLLAFEDTTDPSRDLEYYQTALDKRLNSDDVLLNNFNTQDLIPVGVKCAMQLLQEDALSDDEKSAFTENLDAKVETIQALVKEKTDEVLTEGQSMLEKSNEIDSTSKLDLDKLLKTPGVTPKDKDVEVLNAKLESILPGITKGDPKKVDLTKFSFDKIEEILAAVQSLTEKKVAMAQQQTEKVSEELKLQVEIGTQSAMDDSPEESVENKQLQELLADMESSEVKVEGPLPRMNAKLITEKLSEFNPDLTEAMQSLQGMRAAGIENQDTANLEKMINETVKGQDKDNEESLEQAEIAFKETYFMGAHYMQQGTSPHQDSLEDVTELFLKRVSDGQPVADRDWACINLTGQVLDNIDLSNCYLEQVDFSGASLRNVNFSGAIMARAVLNGADLTGANFEAANVGQVKAHGCNFTDANFKSTKLSKSDFTGSNLSGCVIEKVESLELEFNQADFSGAELSQLRLIDADITGANFSKANLTESVFLQSNFKNSEFQETTMPGCVWADVLLDNINFDKANLTKNCFVATEPDKSKLTQVSFKGACLDNINLQNISMVGSNLSYTSLSNAILNGADLTGSNFTHAVAPQAQFRKARMDHCDMANFNLMEGSLAKAHLAGASFLGANLYSVDFLRSFTGDTDFSVSNLDNTLLKDWFPS